MNDADKQSILNIYTKENKSVEYIHDVLPWYPEKEIRAFLRAEEVYVDRDLVNKELLNELVLDYNGDMTAYKITKKYGFKNTNQMFGFVKYKRHIGVPFKRRVVNKSEKYDKMLADWNGGTDMLQMSIKYQYCSPMSLRTSVNRLRNLGYAFIRRKRWSKQ